MTCFVDPYSGAVLGDLAKGDYGNLTIVVQLALLVDDVVVKLFPLEKTVTTIGRDQGNDIQIDEAGVSGRRAQIRLQPSELLDDQVNVLLEDLGSTNGSLVNDEEVEKCQLKHNDVITIG